MKRRVLMIDPYPIAQEGFRRIIERNGEFELCGLVEPTLGCVSSVKKYSPDIIVLGFSQSPFDDLEYLRSLRQAFESVPILVLSLHAEISCATWAISVGANGYLTRRADPKRILEVLDSLLAGECVVERCDERAHGFSDGYSPLVKDLSSREKEVFQAMGLGLTTKEIAIYLELKPKTIETHKENIKKKLGVCDSSKLLWCAIKYSSHPAFN